ncbi:MAG: secondary thiamine-phosphate synthase enzyme YjbQ [Desulfofustis sp.]|jgi:secondary thiamine-phosphate synthase enzyme|nr:secondary thiamine-phosphate synthase enzyme YjbQ [Desulfofustis sp.]
MKSGTMSVSTRRSMELIDITRQVYAALTDAAVRDGVCILFNPHTTAGLTINEGADPDVKSDIIDGFRNIVPLAHPFKHLEGNSPAHIMASLMGSSLTIAILDGAPQLGTWQKIFFCEFDGPRTRKVHYHFIEG